MDCESRWFVYVVECSDGTYYTGISVDVDRRIGQHNLGRGAKYTRPRTPISLVHSEGPMTRSDALRREIEIKHMHRSAKRGLVEGEDGRQVMASGAVSVVIDGPDVLLVRKRGEDRFMFPAGWIEDGELATRAAMRESFEESGIHAVAERVIGSRKHPETGIDLVYVLCSCTDRHLCVQDEDEIEEARWFPAGEAIDMLGWMLFDVVAEILKDVARASVIPHG